MPTLDWTGKQDAIRAAAKIPYRLLELDSARSCGDISNNLIIHGDNLDALYSLLPFYRGRVKCVYIDPPYNTHSAFEHYNDNMEHSEWLSFMYPRLELLSKFLADDGAIFISIDDNEQARLKIICDEIFGANNFVAQLVWEKKKKGAFLSKTVTNVKEYILVYCKAADSFGGLIGEVNRSPETYPCVKTTNPRGVRVIPCGISSKFKEKNYRIAANTRSNAGNTEMIFLDEVVIENGILQTSPRVDSNWIYQQKLLDEYAARGELFITSNNNLRRTVQEPRIKMLKDLLLRVGSDGKAEGVFTYDENLNNGGWGTNEDANEELHKIFGKQYVFEFSKPSRLIAKLIQSITDKNSIVLDAFAGSGTTAHAVQNLNAADGGTRRFILIERENFCDTITAERVRRVGGTFKYYRLGARLFDETGALNPAVMNEALAAYIWFKETQTPYSPPEKFSPLIGTHKGTAYYLVRGELTRGRLATLPAHDGEKIIFGDTCRMSATALQMSRVTFKQIPKAIR